MPGEQQSDNKITQQEKITVGKILKTFGLKGEVKILPLTDNLNRFKKLKKVFIENTIFEIEHMRIQQGVLYLKFKGFDSPESLQKFLNHYIEIEKSERTRLPKGSYFINDIIGLEVISTKNKKIGKIVDVIDVPGNHLYVINSQTETGKIKQFLLPAVKDFIKKIDVPNGKMIVVEMEGLFEL
jgi:16S rRNA processing protein RimM